MTTTRTAHHTPGPLRLAHPGERLASWATNITAVSNGRPVACTTYLLAPSYWRQEDEANARRIVQCWNAHDALLATLQNARSCLVNVQRQSYDPATVKMTVDGLLGEFRAAIAKAKKGDVQEAQ